LSDCNFSYPINFDFALS